MQLHEEEYKHKPPFESPSVAVVEDEDEEVVVDSVLVSRLKSDSLLVTDLTLVALLVTASVSDTVLLPPSVSEVLLLPLTDSVSVVDSSVEVGF